MALLILKNVTYNAGGKRVLDGLSLAIETQEVHALLGTTRLLSPEGLLVAVTVTPEMREQSR